MKRQSDNLVYRRILLSRFLTRAGDQAWDFAVPIALITIFPKTLKPVAIFYLCVRAASVFLMPLIGAWMDKEHRLKVARFGIIAQTLGVFFSALFIFLLNKSSIALEGQFSLAMVWIFGFLIIANIFSYLGGNLVTIAVSADWIPLLVAPKNLPKLNSKNRQIDLLTEVLSPILTGFILGFGTKYIGFFESFLVIVVWNLISFFPEYFLLKGVFNARKEELEKKGFIHLTNKKADKLFDNIRKSWSSFKKEPVALVIISNSLLWITVLSPHGVLLTGFLKGFWKVDESLIGILRGLGALFGLIPSIIYPKLIKNFGLKKVTGIFIIFEFICLFLASSFIYEKTDLKYLFLGFILLSRIGLYGFGLGETQLKQQGISKENRGKVNGIASSLTGIATLIVYGVAVVFSDGNEFHLLAWGSTVFVLIAVIIYYKWISKMEQKNFLIKEIEEM